MTMLPRHERYYQMDVSTSEGWLKFYGEYIDKPDCNEVSQLRLNTYPDVVTRVALISHYRMMRAEGRSVEESYRRTIAIHCKEE